MWEVYAYWNAEQLEAIFNGVAAIASADAYATLIFTLVLLGFIIVMGTAVARLRAEEPMVWIFFLTFFYGVLLLPKDDVAIIDRTATAGAPRVVANVPLGLAFFASTTSKVGDWLTRTFETVFALPVEVRFTGNGMLFGSRIIQGAMASHLLDVRFNNDLMEYVKTCVAPDLLTGYKSLEDLMKTEDIWGNLGDTNPARAVWLDGATLTCPDGYTNLNTRLPTALDNAHLNMARLINPNAAMTATPAALNGLLAAQIPAAADVLMRVSTANSYDFVRQAIMVNFWRDAPGSLAAAVENTSAAQLAIAQSQAPGLGQLSLPDHGGGSRRSAPENPQRGADHHHRHLPHCAHPGADGGPQGRHRAQVLRHGDVLDRAMARAFMRSPPMSPIWRQPPGSHRA